MQKNSDYHALLSPSSAHTWLLCEQSIALGMNEPDESSEFADEGTAAHTLGSDCLIDGSNASDHIGRQIAVGTMVLGKDERTGEEITGPRRVFTVDSDMADYVQVYIDLVRSKVRAYELDGYKVTLEVEQRVPIGYITGEEGAEGTSDAVIIAETAKTAFFEVIDLKYGRGVQVNAADNPQLKLYALGALEKFGLLADFDQVLLTICQPRVSETPSEWMIENSALIEWGLKYAMPAADRARAHIGRTSFDLDKFVPGEDQCRFCKGRAICPALAKMAEEECLGKFDDETEPPGYAEALTTDDLTDIYPKLGILDIFAKAVLAKIERLTLSGQTVPGTKVVKGRKGNRKWADTAGAEEVLKSMRLKHDEMYDYKLASPTTIEKVLKEFPRKWKKAATLITQSEGSNIVVPESDPRPAVVIEPVADQFEEISDLE